MRVIGMDIHRVFAEVVALLDGAVTRLGRVDIRPERLEEFARSTLTDDDHVVVEATGNAAAVVEVLSPHVGRVVIANPKQVEPGRVRRRLIFVSYATMASVSRAAWKSASASAGGMFPIGSSRRRLLNQSTHSRVACSTASKLRPAVAS